MKLGIHTRLATATFTEPGRIYPEIKDHFFENCLPVKLAEVAMLRAKLTFLSVMILMVTALFSRAAQAATTVSGTLSSDTLWTAAAGPYYVSGNVTINGGVTLTVEQGTVVKFAQGQGLFVNGTLNAVGEVGSEIVFTDFRDDTVGDDSNGDGGATLPAPGWWRGIVVNNLGTATLTRCVVRYAGSANANVYKTGSGDLTVTSSTIRDSGNYGIYLDAATTPSTITGNTISGNVQYGIFAGGNSPASVSGNTISSNGRFGVYASVTNPSSFTVSANTFNNNGMAPIGVTAASSGIAIADTNTLTGKNYVYVEGGAIASNQTWGNGSVSVYYVADDINIASQTLTVQPGTVVKFAQGRALYFTGHLNAPGTTDHRIYFTDFRDDIGGDSNGDGTATAPAPGWWRGLELNNNARATMNYCVVRYGSSSVGGQANLYKGGSGNVSISNSSFTNGAYRGISLVGASGTIAVTSSIIANNAAYGIYLSGSGTAPKIWSSQISGSNIGIYCDASANPEIGGTLANANDIFNNFEYSVQNTSASTINATYNWWGRSGGPLTSGYNKVSSIVDFSSYLVASVFGNSASTPGAPVTTVAGGTISTSVTWPLAGSPYYVSGNVTVAPGGALTINTGVVVKFANRVGFDISGALNATGVTFTDFRDDTGGDSNGDGPASSPAPGWWRGILVNDGGNATISNCVIRYGGSDGPNSSNLYKTGASGSLHVSGSTVSFSSNYGIYLNGAAVSTSITGSTFSNNGADGILAGGNSPTTISGSSFTGNVRYGIYASVSIPTTLTVSGNTFSFNGTAPIGVTSESSGIALASDNTGLSHVLVEGGNISTNSPTWGNASVPITYYVSNNVNVTTGPTLEILPGTVVKFANRIGFDISGELIASNVTFTDFRDDTGGDSNRDGTATSPAPGWWRGILVNNVGNATITDSVIRYGGSDGPNSSNLYKNGVNGSLQVSGSNISFSSGYGIYLNNAANTTTITGNSFRNNGADGILAGGDSPATISGSSFIGNGRYGIYASVSTPTTFTVSANTFTFNGTAPIGVTSESSGIVLGADNTGLSHVQVEGGNISSTSHTWGNATVPITYYVSNNVNVTASPTLTIRSGTVVKFANRIGFDISGRLNATGVTFTDFRDDTAGGDINRDGSATSPAPGWWRGILVNDGGSATISNCVIRYGGSDGPNSSNLYKTGASGSLQVSGSTLSFSSVYGIYLNAAAVATTITGSTFSNNGADGILAGGNSPATISGNAFTNNGRYGIYADSTAAAGFSIQDINTFTANASTPIRMTARGSGARVTDDNVFVGPLVVEEGSIVASLNWLNNRVYYASGVITVPAGATLTVPAGRVVKFAQYTHYAIYGHLQAVGTSGSRIVFTDFRDDEGGNSDGVNATPTPNWWYGILIYGGGSATIDYATVRYAGLSAYGNIWKNGAGDLSLKHTILENSSTFGLQILDSSGNHTVSNNEVRNNGSHGILIQTGGAADVSGNIVTNNGAGNGGVHGIYLNNTPATINSNTVSGSGGYGLYITGVALPASVISNTLNGNGLGGVGMAADSSGAVIGSNTFAGPLHVEGGNITRNTSWVNNRVYYARGVIGVSSGATLTVPAGRVVKFAQGTHYAIYGHLQAIGASDNRIVFTDYRDDDAGGDSDGESATPGPNWWYGVLIYDGGSAAIDFATVRYAGVGSYGNIWKSGPGNLSLSNSILEKSSTFGLQLVNSSGSHTISNNTVRDNGSHGILIQSCSGAITVSNSTASTNGAYGVALANSASGVTISASTFENNTQGGIYIGDSSPLIQGNSIRNNNAYGIHATGSATLASIYKNTIFAHGVGVYCTAGANPRIGGSAANSNNIVNNSTYGVQNTSSNFDVNATCNWWGAPTGPRHSSNPLGTGDRVSDYVDFAGFLASPYVPIAIEQVSPPIKAFGHVTTGTTSAPQVFTITNTGAANLVFTSSSITGTNANQFLITANTCNGTSLATSASCTVTAVFKPTVSRPALAFLTVVTNDIYTPTLSVPLTGAGSIVLPFRDDFSNNDKSPHWFVINEDQDLYNLTELAGHLRIYTTPTNFLGNTNNVKNLFAVALPSGVNRFVATAKMLFPDIAQFPTPNQNYQQGGVTFMAEKDGAPDMDNYLRAQYSFNAGRRFETAYDIDGAPGGYVGPTIDGISSLTPVWIRIIRKATEYTAEYSLDGDNYTLITSMTGPWDVSYVGIHALNGDQSLAPSIPVNIDYFHVYELPDISATPSSANFSSISVGQTSPPSVFTISNAGPGPLTVSSIALNGADPGMFVVNNGTCGNLPVAISSGSSCAFSVTFRPTTEGLKMANISISTNDVDVPVTNLPLSGATSYLLTLTLNGTGSGTVNSSANFSCSSGNCSKRIDYGSIVNLYATHGASSLFTGWSGACSGTTNCSVTMTANRNVTASFILATFPKVQIQRSSFGYQTVQDAYNDAQSGDITQILSGVIDGPPLSAQRGITVTLKGGYELITNEDQSYSFSSTNTGTTYLQGTLTIGTGTVIIDKITLK
jgi:parallel beta-helix repeat protein